MGGGRSFGLHTSTENPGQGPYLLLNKLYMLSLMCIKLPGTLIRWSWRLRRFAGEIWWTINAECRLPQCTSAAHVTLCNWLVSGCRAPLFQDRLDVSGQSACAMPTTEPVCSTQSLNPRWILTHIGWRPFRSATALATQLSDIAFLFQPDTPLLSHTHLDASSAGSRC